MSEQERTVDDFFVEWRGSPDDHCEDDVVISPEDVKQIRGLVEAVLRWRSSGKKRGTTDVNSDLLSAIPGVQSLDKVIESDQRFVVDPGYDGPPATIDSFRKKLVGAVRVLSPLTRRESDRLELLATTMVEKLDESVDWAELRAKLQANRTMTEHLFDLPLGELPGYTDFGDNSRQHFWAQLCARLGMLTRAESRLGQVGFPELQPRIVGDKVEFHSFAI